MTGETIIEDPPRVASVKLRVKYFKDPKLEVFHNDLEDRIIAMSNIHRAIDIYEEQTGFQWQGTNFALVIWDEDNPHNAVFTCETSGLDHPEMIADYVKTIISSAKQEL